ncbi:uncharacterized protein K460DRAFT_367460 [Cucurbitaria berberidis CBS 394.84]|uniref:Protein kinase domain-containing protein n=1 Tax=Cucurbitaria berberidis CBS 394.84 TaxID=1168544 RepID=A0A9P4GIC5_9PLEO|nr:uncharacterized protein K460DRAFT_367460 [Cucurbitaria berberidis CBS 394.84]KAF1846718.1 hypothetical protein K460DRAFT_367460 [Cucurbitaria berberidis CBS 394.84]
MASTPKYEIGITGSSESNTDVELNVSVGDKHFRIDLFTANFEADPKLLKTYLRHVEQSDPTYIPHLPEDPDLDEFIDPLEEFYDWATEPFAELFREIPPLNRTRLYTLQDCLFPEQFVYTLQVDGDELVPVQRDGCPNRRLVGVLLPASKTLDKSTLPVYRPKDIHVRLNDDAVALPPNPRKVYIKGKDVSFFKQILAGDIGMTVTELATYAKIHSAELGEDVRISRLLGVVEDEHTSRIVGLLLSYIDCENTTLSCAAYASEHILRERWLKQITHSLKELHTHQIVWGDAKPDNVLIDVHDDAYLIDFGGGYTNGWVDKELMNTQEGDLQGLQRITAYLARLSV